MPSVASNADVFRNIVDYRLQKKKEIMDYLLAQEKVRTDPQIIKQQWELLRVQYQRLTQMDKDLTDIRQGIQSSADGVLKNIVSGNAQIQSANTRASSESEKVKVGAQLDVNQMVEDKDKSGQSASAALLDKAVEAGNAFTPSPGSEASSFTLAVKDLWDKEYAAKYNALQDPIAKARFQKNWFDHVAQMKAQAAVSNPGLLASQQAAGRTTVKDASEASGFNYISEGQIESIKQTQKDNINAQINSLGYTPAPGLSAPTFAQRAGIPDDESSVRAAYERAFQGRIKIEHPSWYDETGAIKADKVEEFNKLKDDQNAITTFIQSVPDTEKLFLLDSTNVDKELQRRKLSSALDEQSKKLREGEAPKSLADIENAAVIEYNRLYGTPKQKELIAQYSRAKELVRGTNLSQDVIFGNVLSRAIEANAAGTPLSTSFMKDLVREVRAGEVARQPRNRTPDIIPLRSFSDATVKDMVDNGWAEVRESDGAIVVPGTGLVGDTILRIGTLATQAIPAPAELTLPKAKPTGSVSTGEVGFETPEGYQFNTITGQTELKPGYRFDAATGTAIPIDISNPQELKPSISYDATLPPAQMFASPKEVTGAPVFVSPINEPIDRNTAFDAYLSVVENPNSTKEQKDAASKSLVENLKASIPSIGDVTPVAIPGSKVTIPIDRNTAYDTFLSIMDNPKSTEAQKSEASKALIINIKSSVPSDIETVFGPQTKSSDRVKSLASDIDKYAGKKYSQLTPDEQTHLDSVATELVKLHSEVVKSKPSAEVDRTLQSIGTHAIKLQEMDDVNDYSSDNASKAYEAGKLNAKKKGHGITTSIQSDVLKSPSDQKKEQIIGDIAEGVNNAATLYKESMVMDKPVDISKGSLPKEKLDAIKLIASAPIKVSGKELDSSLEKIAGDSWSTPSERSKYRQWYTTFSILE